MTRGHAHRLIAIVLLALPVGAGAASARVAVSWMPGFKAPGTPDRYNRVGAVEVGPASARNVLVLEPGTSAGGGYFVPLAKWIVANTRGWQVWSVERRENLLEDQSALNLAKQGAATPRRMFDYYLGWLTDKAIKHHFQLIPDGQLAFAKQWGMNVTVEDLHRVIAAARKLGGRVVLGGHSLGGTVVTAYATWNFGGRAGADDLAGLVYIDGGSFRTPIAAPVASAELSALRAGSPWLTFGGIAAPFTGLYNGTGSVAALIAPNAPSLAQGFSRLPSPLQPPVPVTNLGQYGYALNVKTSPPGLVAAQGHLGRGLDARGPVHGWDGTGALTPIKRFATMFSGIGINNVDGTEWYFPQRLTDDTGAVANGNPNPAQAVLGVKATLGHHLPRNLLIYAFGARLGGAALLSATIALARQSAIPMRNLILINRRSTYAHNDPAGAYPNNAFFAHLLPFLARVGGGPSGPSSRH